MSQELTEEIEAIEAIYPESIQLLTSELYNFAIPNHEDVKVQLSFPKRYPNEQPSLIQVITKNAILYPDDKYLEDHIKRILEETFHEGDVIVFELLGEVEQFLDQYDTEHVEEVQKLQEKLEQLHVQELQSKEKHRRDTQKTPIQDTPRAKEIDYTEGWIQSDPIVDRGSTFIAYAREVHSVEEAKEYFSDFLQDRRIARAAHNMNAWRIHGTNNASYQDCDDDGETAAGLRMLHLLTVCSFLFFIYSGEFILTMQIMDVWDVMVVVSRWFGGTHIGPDRFKHINASTRDVLIKGGFYTEKKRK